MRALSFAPVLAFAFILWPFVAFAGGLGFSALLGLAAILALIFARPHGPPRLYFLAFATLIVWVLASALWSSNSGGLVSGSFAENNFAVNAAGLRLGLTALATTGVVMAMLSIRVENTRLTGRIILYAFALHGLAILALAVFTEEALALFDPMSDRATEAMQNVMRNANAFALALPLLAGWMWTRAAGWAGKIISAAVVMAALWAFADLEAQSAVIAVAVAAYAVILVWWLPRNGYRILLSLSALYIAIAPLLVSGAVILLERAGIVLPNSFQSRVWAWQVAIDKIREQPLMGHGMEASKTWRETYADHPDWLAQSPENWIDYPVIPGHTHNMALQLWAETGAIGAVLAALSLILVAWRLPRPNEVSPVARYAIAGFIGAALVLFSFTYSLWNEAFWASLAFIACAIILMAKRYRHP